MKKKAFQRALSLVLTIVMFVGLIPTMAFAAEEDPFTVVVSMEGNTLGQGFYAEPTAYTLDEINALLAKKGYAPCTEDTLTAALATAAMLIDKGLEWQNTGEVDSDSFYLSQVKGIDKGTINIPEIIGQNGGPTNDSNSGNDDEWLGEFDYGNMSGWMITVNNFMINVGAGAWKLKAGLSNESCQNYGNTFVVRWMFTLHGYGADLGISNGWGQEAMYPAANKDLLYTQYALSTDPAAKAAVLPTMEKLTATQDEVNVALNELKPSVPEPTEPAPTEPIPTEPAPTDPQPTEPAPSADVTKVLNDTMAKLAQTVSAPAFGTTAGEWSVMDLARGGYYAKDSQYFKDYYDRIEKTVKEKAASVNMNGALHRVKSTENSRLILALSSIGKDATNVGGWNLVDAYSKNGMKWIQKQGINGPIFALIALDTHNYETQDSTIRQQCVDFILNDVKSDGGWALSGTVSDPDITAMALQALVRYKDQPEVAAAAEKAFAWLSSAQESDGGYTSWGTKNSESVAQVIVAATAWGINPDTDARFVKNGNSAVDALLGFYDEASHQFKHIADGTADGMATDQACYALVAYNRFLKGENSLYDMNDVTFGESGSTPSGQKMTAALGLPAKINSADGTAFNATITIDKWDNEANYKLIDFIMTIPKELTVKDVVASDRLTGGVVDYHLEEKTGKLRVAYFDPNKNASVTITGSEFPAELFTVALQTKGASDGDKLNIGLSGMSVKLNSDSSNEASMEIVNTESAKGTVQVVGKPGENASYSAVCLYKGDDVDLIPANKMAVAVSVTKIGNGSKLTYDDGTHQYAFLYSPEITTKTGVSSYVAIVDSSIDIKQFAVKEHFAVENADADTITFGDDNADGVVNAQDALAAVDMWLRKKGEPSDRNILTLNVNADSRLNTFDALGIVEAFVNGSTYQVVTKAATQSTSR